LPPLLVNKDRDQIRAILKAEIGELRDQYAKNGRYTPEVIDAAKSES